MSKRSVLSLLLLTVLSGWCAAAPAPAKNTVPPKEFTGIELAWVKGGLAAKEVEDIVRKQCEDFVSGVDGKRPNPAEAELRAARLREYYNYYFFECDTGLSQAHLGTVMAYIKAVNDVRRRMSVLQRNKQTETDEYKQLDAYERKNAANLLAISRQPFPKADKARVSELRRQKKDVEAEMGGKKAPPEVTPADKPAPVKPAPARDSRVRRK